FDQLDIKSKSEIFSLGLRQPTRLASDLEIALGVLGEYLQERTFLLGQPFSLAPGAQHGVSTVAALRAIQEFVNRTPSQVIAACSRLSFGLDVLDATINNEKNVPDGQFFSWLGQFQWVRRLPSLLDTLVIFRTDVQLTPDSLLTL